MMMRGLKEEIINNYYYSNQQQEEDYCSFQSYHHRQMQHTDSTAACFYGGGGGGQGQVVFQEPILPSPWGSFPAVNAYQTHHQDQFLIPPPPPPPPPPPLPPSSSSYGGLFNRGPSLQLAYDVGSSAADHLRIISETLGPVIHHHHPGGGVPFGLQAELAGKMTAQEIMDAKALAASKSHSEAERRRRERINNHLAKLRSLLPSTTKTDKASLLAEVIQHVKELKRQTTIIAETSPVPTEVDELTVDANSDEDGKFVIKASLCCEDRSDLLPELIRTLKALRLRTLKAEITTLGGRVKNVLFITGDEDGHHHHSSSSNNTDEDSHHVHHQGQYSQQQPVHQYSISSIHEALKAVMEKSGGGDDSSSGSVKRQRTNNNNNNNVNIIEQQQQQQLQHHRSL